MVALLEQLSGLLWSFPVLIILLVLAVLFTVYFRGWQFVMLPKALNLALLQRKEEGAADGEISHFQALMTSLAGAVGTGNIAGVATAIGFGGLGAIFWLWVFALLGMIIRYCESYLASHFRSKEGNEIVGGPMYYLRDGLSSPFLAGWYAVCLILACLTTGNLVQVHSVAEALHSWIGVSKIVTGSVLAFITLLVLLGGIRSIARVTEIFVPIMACLYCIASLVIIVVNLDQVMGIFQMILTAAFQGQAAVGGFVGANFYLALRYGIARSVFSTETGLGTSSIVSAAAQSSHPSMQALVSMTSSFISSIIVCTMTALVIGVTQVLGEIDPASGMLLTGTALAIKAYGQLDGGAGIVTVGLICFAYSTIIAWAYYGEKGLQFLMPKFPLIYFRLVFVGFLVLGSVLKLEVVWLLADCFNGLMLIPNLIGLVLLAPLVLKGTRARWSKT